MTKSTARTFDDHVAELKAEGVTFDKVQKISGTNLRRVFGDHPRGATVQVEEMSAAESCVWFTRN